MKRLLLILLLLAVIAGVTVFSMKRRPPEPPMRTAEQHRKEKPAPQKPGLLPARKGTPESPLQSWERLLAVDGSPSEDRAALADIVTNYLESTAHDPRPAMGTNDEITHALSDSSITGETVIPANHPAIVKGQLVDRWGSPWFFHQLSANVIEVRSAGPDFRLFTDDDVVR